MDARSSPIIQFESASTNDAEELVAIRIAAMRESLERVGRFSPERARERFLGSFQPECTYFIVWSGVRVGFVVTKPQDCHLLLDHLYILPEYQGQGIGSKVMAHILSDAERQGLAIRVGALRGSDSNRFYQSHGFVPIEESEWDIYYLRPATRNQESDVRQ